MRGTIKTLVAFAAMAISPCFVYADSVWSNYFQGSEMARQCYSGSVERCLVAGVTNNEPSFWNYLLGQDHAKLTSVKQSIKTCRPYYINRSYADINGSFLAHLATGTVEQLAWTNDMHFLESCGLPTNALDYTPWFMTVNPETTGGWHNIKTMLENLVVTKQSGQWWSTNNVTSNQIAAMAWAANDMNAYEEQHALTGEWWRVVSTQLHTNARGALCTTETNDIDPYNYYVEFAPWCDSWDFVSRYCDIVMTNGNDSFTTNYVSTSELTPAYKWAFGNPQHGPYEIHSRPHMTVGAACYDFSHGTVVTQYPDGDITGIITQQITLVVVDTFEDWYATNVFYQTNSILLTTNILTGVDTNILLIGGNSRGFICTTRTDRIEETELMFPQGTNGEGYPVSVTKPYYITYDFTPVYITNRTSGTPTYLAQDAKYRALKSQIFGYPYSWTWTGLCSRADFYEKIGVPTWTTNLSVMNGLPYKMPALNYVHVFPDSYEFYGFDEIPISFTYDDYGTGYTNDSWRLTQGTVTNDPIRWGELCGNTDLDYVLNSMPVVTRPSVDSCWAQGWCVQDDFSAIWWNVTNGFKWFW